MDIHREINRIIANLSQPQLLRFEFHRNGCTVILSNKRGEHKYEMSLYNLLCLGFESHQLAQMMEDENVIYFAQEPQP
jgi:hypothetical protein